MNGYVKKDGTVVQPHYRSAPRTAVREEARIVFRVTPPLSSDVPVTPRFTVPGTGYGDDAPAAVRPPTGEAGAVGAAADDSDIREQAAARLLASAKKTEANARKATAEGRQADGAVQFAIAKQGYQEILAKYAETKAAAEARERLQVLAKTG